MVFNLGNVVGLIKSVNPPSKTFLLWAKQIDVNNDPDLVELYHYVSGTWVKLGDGEFANDIPVILDAGESIGHYVNGDVIPSQGKSAEKVMNLISQKFLVPVITSFNMTGINDTIEVGTEISGNIVFTWSITNPTNLEVNSVSLIDVTNANTVLESGLANDGSESANIGTVKKTTEDSHIWQVKALDIEANEPTRNKTINWRNKIFYGASSSVPSNSVEVRALVSERFTNAGNTFDLATGTTEVNFCLALPQSKTLSQVIDIESSNADITSSYVNTGVVSVLDADGTPTDYDLYVLTAGVPYSTNHTHRITIS